MKIVVTDGYTLNPGDLSWEKIESFGELVVYDRTPSHLVAERCRDAVIVLTNKVPFDAAAFTHLPRLRLISVLATGHNIIQSEAAKEKGIVVCNVPAYGTASVAQHTFALLLEVTNHAGIHAQSVARGEWEGSVDWCYAKAPLTELNGKVMGIVGFGNIGRQTARIAAAFGMKVLYHSRTEKQTDNAEFTGMEALFAQSDVVSLHCPLTPGNHGFVNNSLLRLMKPGAFLINTARGPLLNEQDVADALNEGRIAGAALDVLSSEPPGMDNPLLRARNCIITPHNAWMSKEARQRIMNITAQNIEAFVNGNPVNVVNK